MAVSDIELSPTFKTQTKKAITSIVIFSIVYLLIFILALALTALCVYGGVMLIITVPRFITIALGVGLASLGVFVMFFLIKFLFKSNAIDRSHLIKISAKEEPRLFELIKDIVDKVGTNFPKNVYLSSDVNASVFYDSSFWSMFLPIKKNLQIGLGLVNSIHEHELKAILSHEFGHFSQKTMKVGSYVYNVNQVIFNMLYDNESYDLIVQKWANASGYFSIFILIAVKITQGIQWVLKRMYELVNKNYLGLSREMEFHADEVAAHVTGYKPLVNSLLRMQLADHSFNMALSFYESRIQENLRSPNIFNEQSYLIDFFAKQDGLPIENDLPVVTLQELNKFNKSKLVIKDQWASHPSTEDRIEMLEKTNIEIEGNNSLANSLFTNIQLTQETLTNKMFDLVPYEETPITNTFENFKEQFSLDLEKNSFSKVFNGYYDNKNPMVFDLEKIEVPKTIMPLSELFSEKMNALSFDVMALKQDHDLIEQIKNKTLDIKSFDYDGKKYNASETKSLLSKIKLELDTKELELKKNDIQIFNYFKQQESNKNGDARLTSLYQELFDSDKNYESKISTYTDLLEQLEFISHITPVEKINSNFSAIKGKEQKLKESIRELMDNHTLDSELTTEIKTNLEEYLEKDLQYFRGEKYVDKNLETLFSALNNYAFLTARTFFLNKKKLLDYQASLVA